MKKLSLFAVVLLLTHSLHTYSGPLYTTTYISHSHHSPYDMYEYIVRLASDRYVYESYDSIEKIIRYLDNCEVTLYLDNHRATSNPVRDIYCDNTDRTSILLALAQNPGLIKSEKLAHYVIRYSQTCFTGQEEQIMTALIRNPKMPKSDILTNAVCNYISHTSRFTQHALIMELARHPKLGKSNRLVQYVARYLDHCWNDNDKIELLRALGSNPSVYNDHSYAQLFQEEIRRQQKDQDFANAVLTGIAAGTIFYGFCKLFLDEPSYTHTTTYTARYYR